MKANKFLFGATGFSIAAAALLMGAGTAAAEEGCSPEVIFCPPNPSPGFNRISAINKLEGMVSKFGDSVVANKLDLVIVKLQKLASID